VREQAHRCESPKARPCTVGSNQFDIETRRAERVAHAKMSVMVVARLVARLKKGHSTKERRAWSQHARNLLGSEDRACEVLEHGDRHRKIERFAGERQCMRIAENVGLVTLHVQADVDIAGMLADRAVDSGSTPYVQHEATVPACLWNIAQDLLVEVSRGRETAPVDLRL